MAGLRSPEKEQLVARTTASTLAAVRKAKVRLVRGFIWEVLDVKIVSTSMLIDIKAGSFADCNPAVARKSRTNV